jgi:DNA-binding MarR family transcriptional regulator
MNDTTLEQARFLHKTIKALQNKLLHRFGPVTITNGGVDVELTFAQLSTLTAIRDLGALSLKDLARAMQVSPPSASCMVDKLVDMGAVTREASKADRREIRVDLTTAGLTAVNTMENQMLEALGDTLDAIGPHHASLMVEAYKEVEASFALEEPATDQAGHTS